MYQDSEQLLKKIIFGIVDRNQIKVFLFGSRAKGNARSRSDIDIKHLLLLKKFYPNHFL